MLKDYSRKNYQAIFGIIASALNGCPQWLCGTGNQATTKRLLLGHVNIYALSDNGRQILITRILLYGSSRGIWGKIITDKCDITHIGINALKCEINDEHDFIELNKAIYA